MYTVIVNILGTYLVALGQLLNPSMFWIYHV